jgi:hypothetical protein
MLRMQRVGPTPIDPVDDDGASGRDTAGGSAVTPVAGPRTDVIPGAGPWPARAVPTDPEEQRNP